MEELGWGRWWWRGSLTETRDSWSHWKDTVEMWAVWEEAMTPLRHIIEEAEDTWDTQSREGTHGSTESKPFWV